MTRSFYFLLAIAGIGLFAAGAIRIGQEFADTYSDTLDAKTQASLIANKFIEAKLAATKEPQGPATLLFVGDIMLSRDVGAKIKKTGDPRFPFLKIADVLQEADLAFGNLEGPISDRGKNQGSEHSFRADPEVIEGLAFAGFDALSVANNHILDWGYEALEDTLDRLKWNGIDPVGAGANREEANAPVIKTVKDAAIAFLAYTTLYPKSFEATATQPGVSSFNLEKIREAIKNIKDSGLADIVAVSLHWGEEYQARSGPAQQKIARALVDAGADIIIGHHPHVIQEIERYKHGWIAYSLGNFVFDQYFSEETMRGLMLSVTVAEKKISAVEPIEIRIATSAQPEIVVPEK